jgi:hypothetical protein
MPTNEEIATWPETAELRKTPPEEWIDLVLRWLATKNRRKNFLSLPSTPRSPSQSNIHMLYTIYEISNPKSALFASYVPLRLCGSILAFENARLGAIRFT